jgi:hypothetical protein
VESFRSGYPRLSAYVNSDKNFVIFKRFGQVHARLLLHKQSVIAALEARLNVLDEQEANAYRLTSRAQDDNIERNDVLEELEARILEYGKFYEIGFIMHGSLMQMLSRRIIRRIFSATRTSSSAGREYSKCDAMDPWQCAIMLG